MARFELSRTAPLSAADSWQRLTDWQRHAERVPFTRVGLAAGSPQGAGGLVVARTSLFGLGFDDPMEIVRWQPPGAGPEAAGRCRLEKRGRVVRGWAEITITALGPNSLVGWDEEVFCRGVPQVAGPALAAVGRRMFGRVLDTLLAP